MRITMLGMADVIAPDYLDRMAKKALHVGQTYDIDDKDAKRLVDGGVAEKAKAKRERSE